MLALILIFALFLGTSLLWWLVLVQCVVKHGKYGFPFQVGYFCLVLLFNSLFNRWFHSLFLPRPTSCLRRSARRTHAVICLLSTLRSKISQIYVKLHSWHSRQLLSPMWCVPPYWHCIRLIQSNNLIRLDYGNHKMAGQSTCEWISTRTASKERSIVIIWLREPAQSIARHR